MEQSKVHFLIFCVLNFIIPISRAETVCNKSLCRGPIRYYNELKCIPILANPDECCPYQYNCDHLEKRLPDKCYIRDSIYDIHDNLAKYDANPCDIDCTCQKTEKGTRFFCGVVDCPPVELYDGCYLRRNLMKCCAEVVCPENITVSSCFYDGKIYMHGEEFIPKSDPNKICQCHQSSSSDKFPEIHCRDIYCNNELYFPYNESCVPVYFPNFSPQNDCSTTYRCYNNNDRIIKSHLAPYSKIESKVICKFGDLRLTCGDKLAPGTDYDTCMDCTCEVGPILTCRRFPDDICQMQLLLRNQFMNNNIDDYMYIRN